MFSLAYYKEGMRIYVKSNKRKINGFKKYEGDARTICKKVVNDCWNGKYLMTSNGHYNDFWTRDFGWCSEALSRNGWRDETVKTLDYALNIFSKKNAIMTTINPKGTPFDCPVYSIDSLPWITRAVKNSGSNELISKYKSFIENQTIKFSKLAVNDKTGLAKSNFFSSIKDFSIRNSSTYDNIMIAMLSNDLDTLGLKNPLKKWNFKESIIKKLWSTKFFRNDIIDDSLSSDANIFPFITGVINDKRMMSSSINELKIKGLETPLPVKFSNNEIKKPFIYYKLVPNYQGSSVWTNMGPLFIKLMSKVDLFKANAYKNAYKKLIEKYGNYLEVFNEDLTPFQTRFYMSDESMIWAANYLDL